VIDHQTKSDIESAISSALERHDRYRGGSGENINDPGVQLMGKIICLCIAVGFSLCFWLGVFEHGIGWYFE